MADAAATAGRPPARPVEWPAVLKDALIIAGVTLALALPMVGFETTSSVTERGWPLLNNRMTDVVAAVIAVFVGRIGLNLVRLGMALPVAVLAWIVFAAFLFNMLTDTVPLWNEAVGWLLVIGAFVVAFAASWRVATPGGTSSSEVMDRVAAGLQRSNRVIGPVALLLALAFPWLTGLESWLGGDGLQMDRKAIDLGVLLLTYVMLGWGLNIIVGLAGLLDLGYVAFYAVGAYSYALLALHFGWGFWACLPLAGVLAATAGVLLGFPVLRLHGDYFAIVTLGFGEIIRVVLQNWYSFTNGPDGLSGIPRPSFFGYVFDREPAEGEVAFHQWLGIEFEGVHRVVFLYYLILLLALITNLFTMRIRRLPLGRAWEALREDEIACRSLGINPRNTKLTAFAIAAMFGGFAGSFFATRQGFISPESFTFIESALILAIVVLGGMGSQLGIVLAAVLVILLPEWFRELDQYRMLAFGIGMVLIMVWRPRGLLAHREPTIRLHPRGTPGARA
ncbi:MAG: high-affinity branched-chain amino acid ABC transporter permease LivM [Alphaproteobacteria bacterium]